jgi:hypothetical protein
MDNGKITNQQVTLISIKHPGETRQDGLLVELLNGVVDWHCLPVCLQPVDYETVRRFCIAEMWLIDDAKEIMRLNYRRSLR